MRRTREFWARLTREERSELWWLERGSGHGGGHSAYLPDDCTECPSCSSPTVGWGLCQGCGGRLDTLISTGEGKTRP